MSVKIACPACKQDFDIGSPQRADIKGSKIKVDTERNPQQGDFTVCAECCAVLRLKEGGWVECDADGMLVMSDDDRIGLRKVQKIMQNRKARETGQPVLDDEGRMPCGCLPDEHEERHGRMANMILGVPPKVALDTLKGVETEEHFRKLATKALAALMSYIRENSDPIEDNIRDLIAALVAMAYIVGKGDPEEGRKELQRLVDQTEGKLREQGVRVMNLSDLFKGD